jgi:hypothetical protein
MKEPTFVQGLIGSAIPLVAAIAVASIAGFLVYLFWFGTDGIMDFLF